MDVCVRRVSKTYGGHARHRALKEISLSAADGEFLVLLGPSGSGKTTLLRAIAGLESIDSGDIEFGGQRMNDIDPGRREIGMVFQDYALYPHLTVRDNIGYNIKLRHVSRAEVERRVREVAAMLGIEELLDRRPAQLSGGQRQRVALGRAITREASVLLMDEPLSNLDAQIREHVRVELRELQRRIGITTIYVTHDQVEAMVMADRIAVMSDGHVEQIGSPEDVYNAPQTLFCARFVGSPKINEFRGKVRVSARGLFEATLFDSSGEPAIILEIEPAQPASNLSSAGADVILAFRPEDVVFKAPGEPGISGSVALKENRGSEKYLIAELPPAMRNAQNSADLRLRMLDDPPARGENTVAFMPTSLHVFVEKSGQRLASGRCIAVRDLNEERAQHTPRVRAIPKSH